MACEATFGIIPLRWHVFQRARRERIGRSVILEHGITPSAAVSEFTTVFHHEVHVMLCARHHRSRKVFTLHRVPVYFRHSGAVWEWLAVVRNASPVSIDH